MNNGDIPPQGYNQPNYGPPQQPVYQQGPTPPQPKKVGWLKVAGITVLSVFALSGLVQCMGNFGIPSNPTPIYPTAPVATPTPTMVQSDNVEVLKDAWTDMEDKEAKQAIVDGWKAAQRQGVEDSYLATFVKSLEEAVMGKTGRQLTEAEAREFLEWAEQQ